MSSLPQTAAVPKKLRSYDHWVCWREQQRNGKTTKVPLNPTTGQYASTTNSETWTDYETALQYAEAKSFDGLGYVFSDDDPFVGVDLDDARDPEREAPEEWAESIIDQLESFTEVSPSGTGYHVLVEGKLPPGRNRRGSIELYETIRFFTVTGDHVVGTPNRIHERDDALRAVYRTHLADDSELDRGADDEENNATEDLTTTESTSPSTLADTALLERARAASNGAKFERLWRGDTSGYESHSEADMALSCLLAFWTGGDLVRMDSLFRKSGLMREKWDTVHYGDGSTYGETTLSRAASVTTEHYSPSTEQQATDEVTVHDELGDEVRSARNDRDGSSQDSTVGVEDAVVNAALRSDDDGEPLYERERARIETITRLERKLRDLEVENERLRDERDTEQAKRQALEETTEEHPTIGSEFLERVKRLLVR